MITTDAKHIVSNPAFVPETRELKFRAYLDQNDIVANQEYDWQARVKDNLITTIYNAGFMVVGELVLQGVPELVEHDNRTGRITFDVIGKAISVSSAIN
jgi:hypothetical protein